MRTIDSPPLSDHQLKSYSRDHVQYEVWMFLRLGQYLTESPHPKDEQERVLNNAVVESFVIHLRNLIAFLYSVRVQSKDVIAADYFIDPNEWYEKRPSISRELRTARERSHKEVIHLTTDRISGTPPEKRWPILALMREIKDLMTLFAKLASPERIHPSLREFLSKPPPKFAFAKTS